MKRIITLIICLCSCFWFTQKANAATFSDCGVKNISKAQIINCSNVKIDNLGELKKAKQLKYLTIRNADLNTFPSDIVNLKNLVSLDLSNNNIKSLPNSISNLKKLQTLNVNNNNIQNLNSNIGGLTNLTKLSANSNALKYLPTQLGNLKKLKVLELRNNSLNSTISFNGLTQLEKLDLADNLLLNVGSISKTKVKQLNLNNNILGNRTVKSKVATFKTKSQNSIILDNGNSTIKVNNLWYNKTNSIINSIKLSNNKKLIGYKKYEVNSALRLNKKVNVNDYLDNKNNVKKSGTLYVTLKLTAHDSTTHVIKEKVKLVLLTDNRATGGDEENNNQNYNNNNDNGLMSGNNDSSSSGSNKANNSESDKNDSDIKSLFNDQSNVFDSSEMDYYELFRYYVINAILILIIFIPLIILLIIIRKTYSELREI